MYWKFKRKHWTGLARIFIWRNQPWMGGSSQALKTPWCELIFGETETTWKFNLRYLLGNWQSSWEKCSVCQKGDNFYDFFLFFCSQASPSGHLWKRINIDYERSNRHHRWGPSTLPKVPRYARDKREIKWTNQLFFVWDDGGWDLRNRWRTTCEQMDVY